LATNIVMPALEMAQTTGTLIQWLKREGDTVSKGEPIMEVETDKVVVEIEATANGTLSQVTAQAGDVVPVGQTIAWILAAGEAVPVVQPDKSGKLANSARTAQSVPIAPAPPAAVVQPATSAPEVVTISPVARKIAAEHGVDLSQVKADGSRITKDDVLAYLNQPAAEPPKQTVHNGNGSRILASPKARRLATERGIDLATLTGSGPDQAIIAADVPLQSAPLQAVAPVQPPAADIEPINATWRVMADRMTASWTGSPHFYLVREVHASALVELRKRITPLIQKRSGIQPTYTDLFVKCISVVLRDHPRLNGSWTAGGIRINPSINIGLAVGLEDGLIVPVIHAADTLSVGEIALRRRELIDNANGHHLRPADIANGTFTLTNLGMYNVDAFWPILNPPQAAILALGRIADRVIPENGVPVVRPMVVLTLACDHRVVDGVRAAKFLDDLVNLIEEPWGLLA
jgi:pyruvate dehydrogenase E2 component (dihydrolipoamide acetyltransferase)